MAFTNASSLQSKLRTLGNRVDDDATVDVLGMCLYAFLFVYMVFICLSVCIRGDYIHIGVGFEVAYLYVVASSKARAVR